MTNYVKPGEIRKPVVAGQFYPGDKKVLNQQVELLLTETSTEQIEGQALGIISPHAGYMYSGAVAAEAFNQLQGKQYELVAVIAPSHREYVEGISVYTGAGYETPLGNVPVAAVLAEQLVSMNEIFISSFAGHRQEHALEVQLPFLQSVLTDFELIPIVMGKQDYKTCEILGNSLSELLSKHSTLIVASSDLSHFHPYSEAVRMDSIIVDHVNHFDYNALAKDLKNKVCEACGAGPMISSMIACEKMGATKISVLKYLNSGDVIADRREVVGYLSAVIYR